VLIGPGGVGKGTVAKRLVAEDPSLWLSRSWTTRARRPGETDEAYVFTDRETFLARAAAGGFFEWAEFLGHLMGTPVPDPPEGADILLEIDVQGARQVLERRPDATVVLLVPPSAEVQAQRLRGRGDLEDHVARRLARGAEEVAEGRALTRHVVVNDQVEQAVTEVAAIIDHARRAQRERPTSAPPSGAGAPGAA
jgi:guanylate kinase